MSVRPGQAVQPDFINSLLAKNFAAMQRFGDPVLKPFLQVLLLDGCSDRAVRHASSFGVCR